MEEVAEYVARYARELYGNNPPEITKPPTDGMRKILFTSSVRVLLNMV